METASMVTCEEEERKPLMEKAREYIDLVDKILKKLEHTS